jgi:hypothetical protein
MNIRLEIDNEDDEILALYITLAEEPVHRTVEIDPDTCYADEDAQGALVGVEVLYPAKTDFDATIERVVSRYPSFTGLEAALRSALGRVAV